MNRLRVVFSSALVALGACVSASAPVTPGRLLSTTVVPQDLFARVNGVTLHYVDWGGTGDLMLFIPGLSHTAHGFDAVAPAFTDRFHVMGLTRRAHGSSEKTAAGYDLETLAGDIIAFIHAVGGKRTVLVGHSFAGLEMPVVARTIPDELRALVFLDAIYDWPKLFDPSSNSGNALKFYAQPDSAMASWAALERWHRSRDSDQWGAAMAATLKSQTYLTETGRLAWQLPDSLQARFIATAIKGVDYAGIRAPTLAIWANQAAPIAAQMKAFGYSEKDIAALRTWAAQVDVASKRAGVQALAKAVPNARIEELESHHTMQWYRPADVIRMMNEFLYGLK